MRKLVFFSIFFLFLVFLLSSSVIARSGCCSHHKGVCGCGCCDGTPLSAKCAPYYPECNSGGVIQKTQPIYTPPTIIPIKTPTPLFSTNTPTPTISATKSITPKVKKVTHKKQTTKKQKRSFWDWLFR
jgi:hypothetical protein